VITCPLALHASSEKALALEMDMGVWLEKAEAELGPHIRL
jgi:hypothetical protein